MNRCPIVADRHIPEWIGSDTDRPLDLELIAPLARQRGFPDLAEDLAVAAADLQVTHAGLGLKVGQIALQGAVVRDQQGVQADGGQLSRQGLGLVLKGLIQQARDALSYPEPEKQTQREQSAADRERQGARQGGRRHARDCRHRFHQGLSTTG